MAALAGDWETVQADDDSTPGSFDRDDTVFRDWIESGTAFSPEADRYHLYISRACPWAHGAVLVRSILGLDDVISMDIVDYYRDEKGWQFSPTKPGCTPDSIHEYDYLREVYEHADSSYAGKVSVPVLWDRKHETIVNNESIEIMKMLASEFTSFADEAIDLYPPANRDTIDEIVSALYHPINNGVYRTGFATTQSAYDSAVDPLFEALGFLESTLADQRFLAGDSLTLADLRLFPTLVRFDPVYHTHFMCTRNRIVDYPNLWNYTKDIYQRPAVTQTVNFEHIMRHYYQTHTSINPHRIVPSEPDIDYSAPHDRDQF